ncbi:MAG: fasciclin domain-containing protein [Chloroflexota bacterium]
MSGEVTAEAAVAAGSLTTAANDQLTISTEGSLVRVDSASILFPDVDASNGIVQVVDQVLLPELPAGVRDRSLIRPVSRPLPDRY